ncbi:hypothetical protein DL89DRAFT_99131 [Linderina pennispora]|uniref:Peptidase S54 rhomboid domain-containing protein n=1 Tax=Linderina pennispora TaxID=61395 RepID=A0A1Y1VWC3_9FUNG|nr:uncharacterized protein DL89DRAFT_99131 [Linderina pennispora]ORX65582.1 hypothetical protein DL89DRAFT_99131 [Linderina pennispora]
MADAVKQEIFISAETLLGMSPGHSLVLPVIGVNVALFALWRCPRAIPILGRRFARSSFPPFVHPFTNVFSHKSFSELLVDSAMPIYLAAPLAQPMDTLKAAAMYLTSGVGASLAQHLLARLRPGSLPHSLVYSVHPLRTIGICMPSLTTAMALMEIM